MARGDDMARISRRSLLGAGLLGAAAVGLPAVPRAEGSLRKGPLRLRLGHALPTSHPVHPAMERFAAIVGERSGGAIAIDLFADGQIGQEFDLLEQARTGKLDLVKASATVLEGFAPAYGVFNLPFLLRDKVHWRAVVTGGVGETILGSGSEAGLVGLTFYDAGARSFYGHQPILRPDDLHGLKIRVQPSPTTVRMMRLLGAEPIPMQWDLVYAALRSRLIDGAENSLAALVFGPHGEVVRYYSFTEHTMVPDVFLVGRQTWRRLTPRQQELFREAARLSFDTMEALWAKTEGDWRRAGERMGVIFDRPEKQPFVDRVAPLRADVAPPIAELIRRIENV